MQFAGDALALCLLTENKAVLQLDTGLFGGLVMRDVDARPDVAGIRAIGMEIRGPEVIQPPKFRSRA